MSPRRIIQPTYPETAGGWLAIYRYRCKNESGSPMTVDQLGALIGVSGATVRRWESGKSRPRIRDVWTIAQVLQLSPVETAFLDRAFRSGEREDPPSVEVFSSLASKLLETDNPALILDSLFFVRAHNSLANLVMGTGGPELAPHPFLALAMSLNEAKSDDQRAYRAEQLERWLLRFWNSTSWLCGSSPYKSLLEKLALVPGFLESWSDIGLRWSDPNGELIGAPHLSDTGISGRFRVLEVRIFTPAMYMYIEYLPFDEVAQSAVADANLNGSRSVVVHAHQHWSIDPFLALEG